ncbi:hypothetical protein MMC13_007852 [Lambiella insularis]|nr:hypothetical protein [Lambiella insularis]
MASTTAPMGDVPGPSATASAMALIEALVLQMPQCVQAAAQQGLSESDCKGDIECLCKDSTFLGFVEGAIENTCSPSDGQATLTLAKELCTAIVPNLNDTQNALIYGVMGTLIVVATIAVTLRFAARRLSGVGLWWDDYLIVVSLVLSWGGNLDGILGTSRGYGHHILTESLDNINEFGMLIFLADITCIKISILCFYHRLFPSRKFTIAATILGCVQLAWWVSFTGAFVFSCSPVQYFWDKEIPNGSCVALDPILYSTTGINIAADILVLCLPIPSLWALQIELSRKLALIGIFILGSFACMSAVARIPILLQLDQVDLTWTSVDVGIWAVVECNLGILCACIPVMGPLFKRAFSVSSLVPRFNKYSRSKSSNSSFPKVKSASPWHRIADKDRSAFATADNAPSTTSVSPLKSGHMELYDYKRPQNWETWL